MKIKEKTKKRKDIKDEMKHLINNIELLENNIKQSQKIKEKNKFRSKKKNLYQMIL